MSNGSNRDQQWLHDYDFHAMVDDALIDGGCALMWIYDVARMGWAFHHYRLGSKPDPNPEGELFFADQALYYAVSAEAEGMARALEVQQRVFADHRAWRGEFIDR